MERENARHSWHTYPVSPEYRGEGSRMETLRVLKELMELKALREVRCAKRLRVLSALRKTRGILMICKKNELRLLSALRKARQFLMFFECICVLSAELQTRYKEEGRSLINFSRW